MDDAKASAVGARLAEERTRISLGVGALAKACGVTPDAQRRYERGYNFPGGAYLQAAFQNKIDIQYVLTGFRARDTPGAQNAAALYEASGPWSANLLGSFGLAQETAFRESLRGVDVSAEGSARIRNAMVSVAQAYAQKVAAAQTANPVTPAPAPAARSVQVIDEDLLCECIEAVDNYLHQHRKSAAARWKAELIIEIYGILHDEDLKAAPRTNVVELIRRRAA